MLEQHAELNGIHLIESLEDCMRQPAKRRKPAGKECKVCFGEHDDDIHSATVRVRAWHSAQVRRNLAEYTEPPVEVCL
jgi:hypothetical protein